MVVDILVLDMVVDILVWDMVVDDHFLAPITSPYRPALPAAPPQ